MWSLGSNRKRTMADPSGTRSLNKSAERTLRKIKILKYLVLQIIDYVTTSPLFSQEAC